MNARTTNALRDIALASLACVAFATSSLRAQSGGRYEINAHVVGAGQARAAGGGLSMDATIAQAEAASAASGGAYRLEGGFWPVAVNPPPADDLFDDGFE